MEELPYGGFLLTPPQLEPWDKLRQIQQHLVRAEVVPCHLAEWLGNAILAADGKPSVLLERLDLKRPKGRPRQAAWMEWAARVIELENEIGKESAVSQVLEECGDTVSRTTLQTWRNEYQAIGDAAFASNAED